MALHGFRHTLLLRRTTRELMADLERAAAVIADVTGVEPTRYRLPDNVWQAYYLDKMSAAGVSIRDRAHPGFLHQKTTLLYSHHLAVFGSSSWTTASNGTQYEHNYFSTDPAFFEWFRKVFVRKWSSSSETKVFVPLPPDKPVYVGPANTSSGQPTTVVLSWKPGLWAHRADV